MNKILKLWLGGAFVAVELVFYLLIVFVDTSLPINIVSYVAILVCVGFMIVFFVLNCNRSTAFMLSAIFFTALADCFLVLLMASNQALAMTFFSGAQLSYFVVLLLNTTDKKEAFSNCIVRAGLFVVLEIVAVFVLKENFSYLVFVSLFYFANLFTNMVFAFVQCKANLLLAIGLLLFLGCDVVIGFGFLSNMFGIGAGNFVYEIAHLDFNLVWLFYLPSQVCLVLSSVLTKQNLLN